MSVALDSILTQKDLHLEVAIAAGGIGSPSPTHPVVMECLEQWTQDHPEAEVEYQRACLRAPAARQQYLDWTYCDMEVIHLLQVAGTVYRQCGKSDGGGGGEEMKEERTLKDGDPKLDAVVTGLLDFYVAHGEIVFALLHEYYQGQLSPWDFYMTVEGWVFDRAPPLTLQLVDEEEQREEEGQETSNRSSPPPPAPPRAGAAGFAGFPTDTPRRKE